MKPDRCGRCLLPLDPEGRWVMVSGLPGFYCDWYCAHFARESWHAMMGTKR